MSSRSSSSSKKHSYSDGQLAGIVIGSMIGGAVVGVGSMYAYQHKDKIGGWFGKKKEDTLPPATGAEFYYSNFYDQPSYSSDYFYY